MALQLTTGDFPYSAYLNGALQSVLKKVKDFRLNKMLLKDTGPLYLSEYFRYPNKFANLSKRCYSRNKRMVLGYES